MITKLQNAFRFAFSYIFNPREKELSSLYGKGLQNDRQIDALVNDQEPRVIEPFIPMLRNKIGPNYPFISRKQISYGLSSFGYDIRLSGDDFYIFKHLPGKIVDPKEFDKAFLEEQLMEIDNHTGETYFIIPANSYALGVSFEKFYIPEDTLAICMTKSTYARAGVFVNTTPLEPGWTGYLTIEIANCSSSDVKVYANEGIGQLLFFKGDKPSVTYSSRKGKYMNQENKVVISKV